MNDRLAALYEVRKFTEDQSIKAEKDAIVDQIIDCALHKQFTINMVGGNRFLTPPRPSKTQRARDVLADAMLPNNRAYQFLSAIAHSEYHGLAWAFDEEVLEEHTEGGHSGHPVLTDEKAAKLLLPAPLSFVAMGSRMYNHYGWNDNEFRQAVDVFISIWGASADRT
ncbi:hypothetical protein AB0D67_19445 [Streptosporangium sp. NPDC048047]|uniref:hypothetical protein n=1 Tax=Streptosporangium sp. NPDC048047 TaxID=3155748 RepID=UPI0034386AFF